VPGDLGIIHPNACGTAAGSSLIVTV